jgi:hypothetical protein
MRSHAIPPPFRWREAGAWWEGEPPREIVQWIDERGVSQERITELPPFRLEKTPVFAPSPVAEDIALRPRKTRDEKVRDANRRFGGGR